MLDFDQLIEIVKIPGLVGSGFGIKYIYDHFKNKRIVRLKSKESDNAIGTEAVKQFIEFQKNLMDDIECLKDALDVEIKRNDECEERCLQMHKEIIRLESEIGKLRNMIT